MAHQGHGDGKPWATLCFYVAKAPTSDGICRAGSEMVDMEELVCACLAHVKDPSKKLPKV
jgi:hypothetical protein